MMSLQNKVLVLCSEALTAKPSLDFVADVFASYSKSAQFSTWSRKETLSVAQHQHLPSPVSLHTPSPSYALRCVAGLWAASPRHDPEQLSRH